METLFESLATPSKCDDGDELSRFNGNTFSYISPASRQLQSDLANFASHNKSNMTKSRICESRKTMISNIDWMIDYGMLENDSDTAQIFEEMEEYIQECKQRIQQLQVPTVSVGVYIVMVCRWTDHILARSAS